ncbi:carbohydrate ABC transporter permease [Plantibacter sp. Mn2098]|uniref:carbohydrate ABC transporter permease n=1 Tax=Plantibacter sp. Mn2098 TaxID=3395266 RepID=UPI003BED2370
MTATLIEAGVPAETIQTAPARRNARRSGRTKRKLGKTLLGVLAVVIGVIWVFPVYWMINSALLPKSYLESFTPTFFPVEASLGNFTAAIADGTFFTALGISTAVTLSAVVLCLVFAFLAAIAISRFRFKGRTTFVLAVLVVQMLPAEGLFIAQYKMMSTLGLKGSIVGLSLLYIAFVVPFTVWMLRGFVAGIPAELEEAAMMDGLSRTQAFMRITFPLLAPGLVASGVYAFLQCWNEFTVALVLMDQSTQTLPLWLRGFVQQSTTRAIDWGQVMAASSLVAIPVIVFFLIVQGRLTSGLVSGAVKG